MNEIFTTPRISETANLFGTGSYVKFQNLIYSLKALIAKVRGLFYCLNSECIVSLVDDPPWKREAVGSNPTTPTNLYFVDFSVNRKVC